MNNKLAAIIVFVITAGLTGLLHANEPDDDKIKVENAWIREAPPVSKVLAAYMVISNHTARDFIIIGASSPNFAKIEIHRTVIENGIARMQQQYKLTVHADSTLVLEPAGVHMMLFNPVQPLTAGDKVPVTLQFASGYSRLVSLEVKKSNGGERHHQHH